MQEHEYKARDKTVQKMSRDGLREKNLRSKKEKRITGRETDEKKTAGHREQELDFGKVRKTHTAEETVEGVKEGKHRLQSRHAFLEQEEIAEAEEMENSEMSDDKAGGEKSPPVSRSRLRKDSIRGHPERKFECDSEITEPDRQNRKKKMVTAYAAKEQKLYHEKAEVDEKSMEDFREEIKSKTKREQIRKEQKKSKSRLSFEDESKGVIPGSGMAKRGASAVSETVSDYSQKKVREDTDDNAALDAADQMELAGESLAKAFFDGYDREAALKNYEGITVQFKMSGMYLTVQPTEEGYKYLVYDQKLHEISGDACGNPEDSIQKAMYASLKNEGLEDVECVKVDDREFRDKVISHSKEVLASGDVRFTSELGRCETALNGMGRAEIEYEVLFHARAVLEEMGLENEVTLIGARIHGSRSRDDLYRADSDLDVVLSYRGNIREDSFFNELNSYGMAIAGIKIDINPISEERITLAEYIKESEAYLDQQEIKKLAVDLDNFSYEYDTYEYKDSVENREEQVEKITEDILNKDTAGLKDWLTEVSEESDIDSDVVTARSLLSRLENAETLSVFTRQPEQKQPEATITFYVAECMEFPVMGEYHENLTLEEALRIYETIPADRMNGIKGVGFELHDGSDYDGPYDLMRLGKVDREDVDMIQHYKESPLVQKAMDDVEKYFAQKQELTKIEEKPIQKENVPQPKSRKESVLQALRERQAKIKEQEQNTSKEKSKAHKKGDVTL